MSPATGERPDHGSGAEAATTAEEMVPKLLELLDLEEIDINVYRGQNEPWRMGRLFGGQVAAQALMAAGRTVEGLDAHSLHSYFLRPGDPECPVLYTVDRIRDGRSFSTRRVVALQRGKAIFNMSVSFHNLESSYEHQVSAPAVPDPETLPVWSELVAERKRLAPDRVAEWVPGSRPVDVRHVSLPTYLGEEPSDGPSHIWLRVPGPLDDDALLHRCLLTYASDIGLLDNTMRPHGRWGPLGAMLTASLDHCMWFHQPFRVDEWLLHTMDSPVAIGARGLARGLVYTRGGVLVASTAQEGLMRPAPQEEDLSR